MLYFVESNDKSMKTQRVIPEEIGLHIFSFLSRGDKGRCAQVNLQHKSIIDDNLLWRNYFISHLRISEKVLFSAQNFLDVFKISLKSIYRYCHLLYSNDLLTNGALAAPFREEWQCIWLSGNEVAIQQYMENEPWFSFEDSEGRNVLHYSALVGSPSLLQFCLENTTEELFLDDKHGNTVLHYAAIGGDEATIQFCLNLIDLSTTNSNLLHCAFLGGNKRFIDYCLAEDFPAELDNFNNTILHYAAAGGKLTAIGWALDHMNHVNLSADHMNLSADTGNQYHMTPLFVAVANGCTSAFQCLYRMVPEALYTSDNEGRTPFWIACFHHWTEIIFLLLDYLGENTKSVINRPNNNGMTPFYMAVKEGYRDIVYLLLQNGAQSVVNQPAIQGTTPLISAAFHGHFEIVEILLRVLGNEASAAIVYSNELGQTPLYGAALGGHARVVELLLLHGAKSSLNQLTRDETTVLHAAVNSGDTETVSIILKELGGKAKKVVNQANKEQLTPLFIAAGLGQKDILRLLLSCSAKTTLNYPTKNGVTPLISAVYLGRIGNIELLLECDARSAINQCTTNDHQTALHLAVLQGNKQIIQLLLQNGASESLYIRDINEASPLLYAITLGNVDIVNYLIEALGENANSVVISLNTGGRSCLMAAASTGNVLIMKLLFRYGAEANLNQACSSGITPLGYAVREGHYPAVEFLLQKGASASINLADELGDTPIIEAARQQDGDIFQLLLGYGANIYRENNSRESAISLIANTPIASRCQRLIKYKAIFDEAYDNLFGETVFFALFQKIESISRLNYIASRNRGFFDDCLLAILHELKDSLEADNKEVLKILCSLPVVQVTKNPVLMTLLADLATGPVVDLPVGTILKLGSVKTEFIYSCC